jgi:hypothetical protein
MLQGITPEKQNSSYEVVFAKLLNNNEPQVR